MATDLVHNLIYMCCFLAGIRILLTLTYLSPHLYSDVTNVRLGYSMTLKREHLSLPRESASSNVSFIGYHDDTKDKLREIAEDRNAIAEQKREKDVDTNRNIMGGDEDDMVDDVIVDDAAPAAAVSQNFDLMPAGGCPIGGAGIRLLTLVHSLPPHFDQREAIRDTWAKNASTVDGYTVKTYFITPGVSPRSDVMSELKKESETYNDLIHSVAGDSLSSFRPSSKVLLSEMGWVLNYCPQAKFVLFAHDELFVNYHHILARLKLVTPKSFASFSLGRVKKLARVERDSIKWDYVSETAYAPETYPNYCVGGAGFVMSVPFIKQVHPKALKFNRKVNIFPLSDVMVGIATKWLNAWPRYHEEFHKTGGEADYCDLKDTLTLGDFNTPRLMRSAWKNHTNKMDYCPNPIPNATEVSWWTENVNYNHYFTEVMHLIHKPNHLCDDDDLSLVALVSTHPDNSQLRNAIRQTWGHSKYVTPLNVRVLFVLGRSVKETQTTIDNIQSEVTQYGDIIQGNFFESFHNLTLKVILGLRWVSLECPSAKFIYKGDDDMLVNFEHMVGFLRQLPSNESENLFMGNMMSMSPVIRTPSKYQVRREVYPFKYFLPYFSGGGYIMGRSALQKMYRVSETTKLIPIDDAYAGILAYRAGVKLKYGGGFIVGGSKRDACRLRRAFNMHGFKRIFVFKETWSNFRNPEYKCEEDKAKKTWSHIA